MTTAADSAEFYNNCLDAIQSHNDVEELPNEDITVTIYNYKSWIYIPSRVFTNLLSMGVTFSKQDGMSMQITYQASQTKAKNLQLYAILSACRNSATVDIHGFAAPFIMFSDHATLNGLDQAKFDKDIARFAESGRMLCLVIFNDGLVVLLRERFGGTPSRICFMMLESKLTQQQLSMFSNVHIIKVSMLDMLAHALYVISSRDGTGINITEWIKDLTNLEPIIEHSHTMIHMSIISGIDMRPLLSNKISDADANF